MQGPVGAFAWLVWGACHLDEAVIEGQRMPDGVLPTLLVLPVVREEVHDPLVDFTQGQHLAWSLPEALPPVLPPVPKLGKVGPKGAVGAGGARGPVGSGEA